ncbi:hypothetical protein BTZ20_5051 [Rhodococcus sp. MTM3W5.2]|nr:hypothetical protein BTZ20_5051 [Rhodococcus sp. MTM3W5.2]
MPRARSLLALAGAHAAPRGVVAGPGRTPLPGPAPPCDASTWIPGNHQWTSSARH